jgi:RNA polymerase sigma-70 factor (ECF subfamily)
MEVRRCHEHVEIAQTREERANRATPVAVEDAYRAHHAELLRVATVITGDADVARDAVQEGLARALARRRSFRGTGSLDAWLWKVVVNAARNMAARTPRAAPLEEHEAAAPSPPDHDLRALVARLPERQRLALFLRYYAGLDYAAIARVLGVRRGTVSSTLNHAHTTLRLLLEEAEDA